MPDDSRLIGAEKVCKTYQTAETRRAARARPHRLLAAGRRDRRHPRQVGLGQIHLPARARGADAADRGQCRLSRPDRRRRRRTASPWCSRPSRSSPGSPCWAMSSSASRRRACARAERRQRALDGDRPHRPRRLRIRLSQGALRRHAPARRIRPRARRQSRRAAARRAVLGARRADGRDAARRPHGSLGRAARADQGHHPGLAQHRGGGRDRRPHHHLRQRSRPYPRRDSGDAGAPARPSPARASARSSTRSTPSSPPCPAASRAARRRGAEPIGIGYRLPAASIQQLVGLLDAICAPPYPGAPTCRIWPRASISRTRSCSC